MLKKDGVVYVCKSDITKSLLKRYGFPDYLLVKDVLKDFYSLVYRGRFHTFTTGNSIDKRKRRHTTFVNIYELYRLVVKGL